uniref:39S ribosomal protein L41, mitochondrial n=1 Tax=Haemonchus placei TaxID=6290 RepID=A0A0N4X0B6_HAEPC
LPTISSCVDLSLVPLPFLVDTTDIFFQQYPYLDLVPEVYKRSLYGVDDGFTFKGFRGLRGKRMPYMNLKGLRGKRTL